MKAKKDMKIKHKVTRRKLENQQNRRQRKKIKSPKLMLLKYLMSKLLAKLFKTKGETAFNAV